MSARTYLDDVEEQLVQTQRKLRDLKAKVQDPWLVRELELLEDRVFNALSKLGD
jgi:cell division septum initiation protein DivIVA